MATKASPHTVDAAAHHGPGRAFFPCSMEPTVMIPGLPHRLERMPTGERKREEEKEGEEEVIGMRNKTDSA